MFNLNFQIDGAEPVEFAVVPQLALNLRIEQEEPRLEIQNILLNCQIRIEPTKRRYSERSQQALADLFGSPDRWSQTVRSMFWQNISVVVPAFKERIALNVPIPCSFDFNVAATKYFHGLQDGDVPLCLLFSGTTFYRGERDEMQIAQIPWEKEAKYRLPVQIWQTMMDHYYPNAMWLHLSHDVFESLTDYKRRNSLATWDAAISNLISIDSPTVVQS